MEHSPPFEPTLRDGPLEGLHYSTSWLGNKARTG
jgi:hypothetical protein